MKKLFLLLIALSMMSACGGGWNDNGIESAVDINSSAILNGSSAASMDPYWECYNSAENVMLILTGPDRGSYDINNGFTCTYKMGYLRFLY